MTQRLHLCGCKSYVLPNWFERGCTHFDHVLLAFIRVFIHSRRHSCLPQCHMRTLNKLTFCSADALVLFQPNDAVIFSDLSERHCWHLFSSDTECRKPCSLQKYTPCTPPQGQKLPPWILHRQHKTVKYYCIQSQSTRSTVDGQTSNSTCSTVDPASTVHLALVGSPDRHCLRNRFARITCGLLSAEESCTCCVVETVLCCYLEATAVPHPNIEEP